ncbi:KamA family radical SAM protein [Methanoplanus sp. FWC-SCC4]|uniref:KamA family radical SAM protein n=1 Tax=Methanochimaera problematica TaxID=2609417 RepID=A0AA97FG21_9EURY|nr:KamA family radical SAM protein [Methanoplanus sp. FWC-SCC4]WOF16791.1 KamA family radical SAM protein [Methanoplanus sp. FWC-SCC4]
MYQPKYITDINKVSGLSKKEKSALEDVSKKFAFRTNEYYLSLIDWEDQDDPIRKIVIPDPAELENWGKLDASEESGYVVAPGMEHKYEQTALLLVSDMCAGYCRYCFRKRLFMDESREVARDISKDIDYISSHPEITNVLLSGGDPMFLSTKQLENIIARVREIDHVRIIRIGTKVPAYNPYRIINDPLISGVIRKYSADEKKIYIITQFNHPRELTEPAIKAVNILQDAGAILANQTPVLNGINDNPDTMAELLRKLSFIGVAPYYIFQCRPTLGDRHFVVPVEEAYFILEKAKMRCSGLSKRFTYAMSHKSGKIAVVGIDDNMTYMKYHQAADPENIGKFMSFKRNTEALWFDDYDDPMSEKKVI